ncbi:ribonuclease Z [Bacteroidetes bacterium endosymbiont of Geopemphigus sp.]|uniref:ribonuclease Z n=1 Tax=Bacteroidetes bacterium endosymbiont of Geopemphigus sp. TaxID=2047937 RepID=UPI000CD0AFB3|nr:ribonuclease Z [Bacteroidetes bacterium endosymbiont of Geopemphigus sp.]
MKHAQVTVLGAHSAFPAKNSYPTAQALQMKGHLFLIDCGEGTQRQLRKARIRFSSINRIFISHLHGDHFFGLIGLISTYQLMGREAPLSIYSPRGLKKIIELQLVYACYSSSYPIEFIELNSLTSEKIWEDDTISVQTIPLKHRIYTNGFLFKEKPNPRRLNVREIKKYPEITYKQYVALKNGEDLLSNNQKIENTHLTLDPPEPLSYAFCSDTSYHRGIVEEIQGVNLLYHESTYLDSEAERAAITGHSTAKQAAMIAKEAQVKKLLLGHYSQRFPDIKKFEREAQKIFRKSEAVKTLRRYLIE